MKILLGLRIMVTPISINSQIVLQCLQQNDYSSLEDHLKQVFKLERDEAGTPLKIEFSSEALDKLHMILQKLAQENLNDNHKDIIKELFRSLRNYVINPDVQNYIVNNDSFLRDVDSFISLDSEAIIDTLQIILQFLFNLIISNNTAVEQVYKVFFNKIITLLKERKNIYETSALLYNISLVREMNLDFDTYLSLLELYESYNNAEYVHFLLERSLSSNNFWGFYKRFDLKKRLVILGIIVDKQIKGETLNLSMVGLKLLTSHFADSGKIIFQTAQSRESNLEAYEVSQLAQVISSFCGNEDYLKVLQEDKDLLINTGVLLINLHRLGKENANCFSPIQSLSEIREPTKSICEHPAFGFKADLIRIIGNLCWKNKLMQDLTREAELIPVILDCCNMDARNPFIMQWVILAVRNLCEKNLENQKIVAAMHQEGTVSSTVLEELGLTLDSDGTNSVKIVPLESLRNHK